MTQEKTVLKSGALNLPFLYIIASLTATCSVSYAADLPVPQPVPDDAVTDPITNYFLHWFDRAEEAQATQPHWMTPITTVTPRLEQEYRYDQSQQFLQNGAEVNNYFSGKGLELIPTTTNEILINVPNFEQRLPEGSKVKPATGFADGNFVTIKQRLLSANEENGNYILSAFLGFQAPTGITAFTNRPAWIVTPTIAGGIGWGDFDVQGTIGYTLPTDNQHVVGTTLLSSLTVQYHLLDYFWPEFAFNDTQWTSGMRADRNQLFVSPGIMFGRFQIYNRVKFNFGIASQVAVVPEHAITSPLTPLYNHAWILSTRMTFWPEFAFGCWKPKLEAKNMRISARNVLEGTVKEVKKGATTSHVLIDVKGLTVTSSITNEAVDELGLKTGAKVKAIIIPSDVMVAVE